MIDKIRKRLVCKYTAIIAVMLLLTSGGGYIMYDYVIYKAVNDTMFDALASELKEAEDAPGRQLESEEVKVDIYSIYNFTYWYDGDKLIYAEAPQDKTVDRIIRAEIEKYQTPSLRPQHFSVYDDSGQRWSFYVVCGQTSYGRVFVVLNATSLKILSSRYMYAIMLSLLFMLLIAVVGVNILANRSIAPLAQMLEKQKRFVSDASHELRTPLAVLLSSLELQEMQKGNSDLTASMKKEVLGMSRLINELLELTRSDNKQLIPAKEEFEIGKLVAAVLASLNNDKNILLQNLTGISFKVTADKAMIRRLLYILVENAVKYSPEQTTVTVRALADEKSWRLEVADEGIGIAPQDILHIFERFFRADKARNRNIAGMGLGLPIAKTIVELHGGAIEVTSVPGKGSVFTAIIPYLH